MKHNIKLFQFSVEKSSWQILFKQIKIRYSYNQQHLIPQHFW